MENNTLSRMLNFEVVVTTLGSEAVKDYCSWMNEDEKALEALAASDIEGVCAWLNYYGVLRGLTTSERKSISAAIIDWARSREPERDLSSPQLLDEAHQELSTVCAKAINKDRYFTSLASKALWLCYPQQVPIFDSFALRALLVLSQIEEGIEPIPADLSDYGEFAHIWQHFFRTYETSIEQVGMQSCRYAVRVLDVILLRIGKSKWSLTPKQAALRS